MNKKIGLKKKKKVQIESPITELFILNRKYLTLYIVLLTGLVQISICGEYLYPLLAYVSTEPNPLSID